MKLDVLYEDNHLLVVQKPAGWLSQGDHTSDATITDPYKKYIKDKYKKPGNVYLHPAHRLDRPVSGCIILGRTTKGLSRIQQLFKDNKVIKEYLAIVHGAPNQIEATLNDWLYKDQKKNRAIISRANQSGAKKAVLTYECLRSNNESSLLLVKPLTGRSHQIRVQLSHIGCPIWHDLKYGSKESLGGKSIALHCFRMSFKHPTQDRIIKVSSLPPLSSIPWRRYKSFLTSI